MKQAAYKIDIRIVDQTDVSVTEAKFSKNLLIVKYYCTKCFYEMFYYETAPGKILRLRL